ncbi:MAG: hypothetical protein ACREX4_17100 [Gammaproteobacteria bacterium]
MYASVSVCLPGAQGTCSIIYDATSEEQHSFDSTCRRLRRFLQDNASNSL